MKTELEEIGLEPGRYVLAVSGGVDSMVLLDVLSGRPGIELIVAHFNHGIREDSLKDEKLVGKTAKELGLVFEVGRGNLGVNASEDRARQARYNFLEGVREKSDARTIVTAHHQDDLIETAVINVLRGSGRRGLSAIRDNPRVLRPLIDVPKNDLIAYARTHKLRWLDDSTNQDLKHLRNYVRLQLMPKLKSTQRSKLLKNLYKVAKNRTELDNLIATLSQDIINQGKINRTKFALLPTELANELIIFWLRERGQNSLDRKTVERLSMGLKTSAPGTRLVVAKNLYLKISRTDAHFSNR